MATIKGKAIATKRSNHFCPGPAAAVSLTPPTPPAGPVPAPFAYVALSSSATNTKDNLEISGSPVLVVDSAMDIQKPGNIPSQSTGGDVVTHAINAVCGVISGSSTVRAGGKEVACTGDQARLNEPTVASGFAQITGTLLMATMMSMVSIRGDTVNVVVMLDPISVATGDVVDANVDIAIQGLISVEWKRLYSTARVKEHTPLGRGGWTHAYHQWIEIDGEELRLREPDGTTVVVPRAKPREPALHRGRRLVVTRDARGGATVFSLDTRLTRTFQPLAGGRAWLREIANASGQKVILEYEAERLARIIDVARRTIAFTHDGDGHITRLSVFPVGAEGRAPVQVVSFAYGDGGELLRVTDPLGNTESYAYDERRRLTRKTLPNGLSFHYLYDPETGRCIRSWGDGGLHAGDLTYDLDKGITHLTGTPEPCVFGWQKDGTVVRKASSDGSSTRELKFDADGLLIEEKNALGEAFALAYDTRGNLTRITDPLGPLAELEYADDLPVRRRIGDKTTEYSHDHCGRLTSVKYPSGASLALSYDEQGRLAAVNGPDGLRGGFVYDEQHNVVEERTPRGGVRRWRYDALGRPVVFTDPLGRVTRRELDALGRPIALHLPDGTSCRFEYDALGRMIRRIDGLGRVESFRYAGLKSPIEVTQPDGSVWSLSYDLNERLQQVKNPKGEAFDLRYDRAGNIREIRSFDGRISRAQRGKNGRLARVELPDGTWRALRYDEVGVIVAEETPHGTVKIERREGRIIEYLFDDPAGKVSVIFEHDELGRVVRETQNGRTLRYEYDVQNRCIARHLPTGQVTRFSYDEEGNVSTLDHDGYRVEIQRDLTGSVLRKVFASAGLEARRTVDAMMRPTRDWAGRADRTLVDRVYTYNASGALTERNDVRWGPTRYSYDAIGMLLEASSPKGRESFEYDAGGSLAPAGAAWETGPGGLLLRTEEAEFAYDEASRRTRELQRGENETEYLWDCRGQLREVRRPDGTCVRLAYDPFGRRIRKEILPPFPPTSPDALPPEPPKSRIVEYLWDGICLIAEIDSDRGVRVFIHEPGTIRPLLQQEGSEIYAVITDHLGTPTELIGSKGELAWSARHSAFGVVTEVARPVGGPPVASPFRLLGQYHDEEIDLCYVRYRYFDPKVARFLSPDPLELLGGRNLFAFDGSPTTHVDPLGLSCIVLGNPALDQFVAQCMASVKSDPNKYTVVVHGLPNLVMVTQPDGSWAYFQPQQLTDKITEAGNYDGRGEITLNSCNTGRTENGVAQHVSSTFQNARVRGPSDVIWGLDNGIAPPLNVPDSSTFRPPAGFEFKRDPDRPGQWNWWRGGLPTTSPDHPERPNVYNQYRNLPPAPGPSGGSSGGSSGSSSGSSP